MKCKRGIGDTMKIVEIFNSIEGEGIRAGRLCTFVRTFGCNLKCSYCDSTYACDLDQAVGLADISPGGVVQLVGKYGTRAVTLTGGEPTIQPEFSKLFEMLIDKKYQVNVETNGSINLAPFIDLANHYKYNHSFFTMDIKCPSSGMHSKMDFRNLEYLRRSDVLKFVVGDSKDLHYARQIIKNNDIKAQIFISPVYGGLHMQDIVQYMKDNDLNNVRLQLQLHKVIWPVDMKGV